MNGVTLAFCTSDAIDLNDADGCKVTKSTLLNNVTGVQVLDGGTGNEVSKNTCTGDLGSGIEVRNATGTMIAKNVVNGSTDTGILVAGDGDGQCQGFVCE